MFLPGSLPAMMPVLVKSIEALQPPLSTSQPNSPGALNPAQVGALGASRTKIRTVLPKAGGVPPVAWFQAQSDSVIAIDCVLFTAGPHSARAHASTVVPA